MKGRKLLARLKVHIERLAPSPLTLAVVHGPTQVAVPRKVAEPVAELLVGLGVLAALAAAAALYQEEEGVAALALVLALVALAVGLVVALVAAAVAQAVQPAEVVALEVVA